MYEWICLFLLLFFGGFFKVCCFRQYNNNCVLCLRTFFFFLSFSFAFVSCCLRVFVGINFIAICHHHRGEYENGKCMVMQKWKKKKITKIKNQSQTKNKKIKNIYYALVDVTTSMCCIFYCFLCYSLRLNHTTMLQKIVSDTLTSF